MGVLAPGSAHDRPSAQTPIDSSGNFPAHVSAESTSISPNRSYPKFQKPRTTFEPLHSDIFSTKKSKKWWWWWGGGVKLF